MSLFKEIYTAYTICRLHKQFSKHQVSFEMQLGANLIQLTKELSDRNYKLSPHHYFIVTKPKPREIFSAHFRDRVIHHYLVSKLTSFWEKKFSHSSFACRKGKGTLGAIRELQKQVHKISQGGTQQVYVLQMDIASFFCSIHRPTLVKLFQKHTYNPHLKWLVHICMAHDARIKVKNYVPLELRNLIPKEKSWFSQPAEFGIPIGNLTSQFAANVYLNDLDHFIVRSLKPKSYLRYVDDLTFVDTDKNKLERMITLVKKWLFEQRKMHINDAKTKLTPLKNGIAFLGYKIEQTLPSHNEGQTTRILMPKIKKWKFLNDLRFIEKLNFRSDKINHPLDVQISHHQIALPLMCINSGLGHIKHANSFEFKKKTLQKMRNKNLKFQKDFCAVKLRKRKKEPFFNAN